MRSYKMNTLLSVFCLAFFPLSGGFPNISLFAQQELPRFVIEQISVEGNSKSNDSVVLENLPFTIGDTASEEEIYASIEHLKNLEIFNDVQFQPMPGSQPGHLKLLITVVERYWPSFRFKGGFSELEGWYITPLSLNMDNIFGLGNFISLDFSIGDRISSVSFNYINPDIFQSDFNLHFKIFLRGQQFVHYIDDKKFIQNVPGGGYFLGLQSRSGFFNNFLFGWQLYATTPDSFFTYPGSKKRMNDLPDPIARYSFDTNAVSAFTINFNSDSRDDARYPVKGWWFGAWLTQADKQLGSKIEFTRVVGDVRSYFNIWQHIVLASRLKLGWISESTPFYEKFYLGGPNSLRGFPDRSLSPVGGGYNLYQAGAELRIPISAKNFPGHFLTGAIFYDAGLNLLSGDAFSWNKVQNSFGFGLRFRIPFIGLLRMDSAYPINSGESRLQFSLGHTF